MESIGKRLLKRAGILAISFIFLLGYLVGGALVPKEQAHATFYIDDWLFSKVFDGIFNVVNAAYLGILGKAIDTTDNESIKSIEQFLINSDNLIFAGGADSASDRILEELDVISGQISAADASTKKVLNEMFAYEVKTNAENLHKELNRSYNKLATIQDQYEKYVDVAGNYAEQVLLESQGKAGKNDVQKAQNKAKLEQENLESAFREINFLNELNNIAESCCVFYPNYSSDYNKRGNPIAPISQTYLGQTWKLLNLNVPFDHQKYEGITAAANDSAKVLQMALQVSRLHFDYYNAKFSDDPKKTSKMQHISDDYNKMANGVIHCLNDLTQQCIGFEDISKTLEQYIDVDIKLNDLMRPYDVETVQALKYEKSATHKYKIKIRGSGILSPSDPFTTSAVDTKPEMEAYRAGINGTPYLFFKGPFGKDLVDKNLPAIHYYIYGQDYCNLQQTADNAYTMPRDYKQVVALTDTGSYGSGNGSFLAYLKELGGLTDLPSSIDYVATQDGRGYLLMAGGSMTDMAYWCKDRIPASDKSGAQAKVDLRDVYKHDNKVLVMMVGNKEKEKSSVSVRLSDARGNLSVTNNKGEMVNSKVEAGTMLTLKLKLKEGAQLRSLKWISKDSKTTETIATGDSIDLAQQDKDGAYTFDYPMSYQDCTFQADFTNGESGEGSESNPYLISSAQDYADYAAKAKDDAAYNKAYYKLIRDLDFIKEKVSLNNALGSNKDGFTGVFDGGGHTICGVNWWGPFDTIGKGGVVRDFTVSTGGVQALTFMSLVARENNGLITGCGVLRNQGGMVNNSYNGAIGAITQSNGKTGVIENSYNALSITASDKYARTASIAADNAGVIRNCYNVGDLTSVNNRSSGISTINYGGSAVFNCYNAGAVNGSVFSGESGCKISDVFYQTGNGVYSNTGTGLSQAQMKGDALLTALNKNVAKTEGLDQWLIKDGINEGYPILGTVPDRHTISSDIKGKGSLTITDDEGKEIHKAVSGAVVKAEAAPESDRQVDKLRLWDENGKTIQRLEVKPDATGRVKTSFVMPDQNVAVHVKFVKQEAPADGQEAETNNTEQKIKRQDGDSQKAAADPVYDKAVLTDKASGITVAGDRVDTRAILKVETYNKTDPEHIEIEDAASDDVLASYDVSLALLDEQGKEIKPDGEKFKGTLDVAFPIKASDRSKSLKVLHGSENGLKFEDGGLEDDGLYHVKVSHLSPFAVVEYTKNLEANLSEGETIEPDGGRAWIWAVIVCLAAVAFAVSIWIIRHRRKEKGKYK